MRDQGLSDASAAEQSALLDLPASGAPYRAERNLVEPLLLPDGSRAVRKTFRELAEYGPELSALRQYAAIGSSDPSVRMMSVLAASDDHQSLLLEHTEGLRLDHGWPDARRDEDVTADLARAMRALWCAPASDARMLRDWMRALWRPVPPNPALTPERVAHAAAEAEELLSDPTPAVQLHGDLHHENVYRTADGQLSVIDPKGVAGHPAFDVVAQIWNPGRVLDHPSAPALLRARVEVLAGELRMDIDLLRAWIRVGCVLSAAWYFEDDTKPDDDAIASATDVVSIADLFAL